MAWIESHQQLLGHPKTADLSAAMGWDLDQAIGKLHRFWWWCMDYAEDGDLRRVSAAQMAGGVGISPKDAKRWVGALRSSKFVDRAPYLRVHDWWEYAGPFLRSKYKRSPEKWQRIRTLYVTVTEPPTEPLPGGEVTGEPNLTNQPNQPNLTAKVELDREIERLAAAKNMKRGMWTVAELEGHRLPFGPRRGIRIMDMPAEEASWFLNEFDGRKNLDPKTRAALQHRCDVKRGEMIPVKGGS